MMISNAEQDEKDIEMLVGLAQIHLLFGQHTTALHILELSYWINRKNIQTLQMIARCQFNLGKPEQVVNTLDILHKEHPNRQMSEEELLLFARSYALLGEDDLARRALLAVSSQKNTPQNMKKVR